MAGVISEWHAKEGEQSEGNLPDFFFMEETPEGDIRIAVRQGEAGMDQRSDPTRGMASIVIPRLAAKALFR